MQEIKGRLVLAAMHIHLATAAFFFFQAEAGIRDADVTGVQTCALPIVIAGCLIGAGAMAILAFAHHQQWQIYVSNAIMGVGFGLAFSAMSALIVVAVPPSQTGVASGMNANIRTIGGSIGSAAMASIVTSHLAPSGLPKESGYTTGFAVMTGGLVLAALAGLLIPSVQRLRQRAGEPGTAEMAMAADGAAAGGAGVGGDSE